MSGSEVTQVVTLEQLRDGVALEQAIFQSVARQPEAVTGTRRIQDRFDGGETPRPAYGPPRD